MSQNTSSAVMAQRKEPDDSLDFFPTPAWATRALCDIVLGHIDLKQLSAWDPACGQMHMVTPLQEYFRHVYASDIFDYGAGGRVQDFLFDNQKLGDFIITNPPFKLGDQFVEHALKLAKSGVAMFVRTQFLEGTRRYKNIFSKQRPAIVAIFTERVPLYKSRIVQYTWDWSKKYQRFIKKKSSTATSYCWIVWLKDAPNAETEFVWIPECRKRLERQDDYPPVPPDPNVAAKEQGEIAL